MSKTYKDKVAALGCIICQQGAQLHHIRTGQGMSQRASDYLIIPLCPDHHTGALSIHMSPRQFTKLYGSELDLLAKTIELLQG